METGKPRSEAHSLPDTEFKGRGLAACGQAAHGLHSDSRFPVLFLRLEYLSPARSPAP